MAGDPALIVRVTTNLDDLKTGMAESKAAIGKATQEVEQFAGKASSGLTEVDKATQGVTGSTGSMLGTLSQVAGAFGLAFSAKAVVDMALEVVAAASALEKMHAQTSISVEDLQRMQSVGAGVGVSLDTMTDGASRLQAALGKGDKGTSAALADLNIDLEKFKTMGAHEQMATLAEAVKSVHDPLRLAADLQAIYGKGWAEQLPALQKGFKETGAATVVWSADTVAALDAASNSASGWWVFAQKVFGVQMANLLTNTSEAMRVLESDFKAMLAATDKLGPPKGLVPLATGLVDVSGAVAELNKGLDEEKTKTDAAVAANNKYIAAWAELEGVGGSWQDTLAGINGKTVDAVKFYLDAGVAQNTLATAYGLTATQVKAVATAQQDAAKATSEWAAIDKLFATESAKHYKDLETETARVLKIRNQTVVDGNAEIMAASATLHDMEMKASLDTTTYQINKIWEKAEAEIAAFKGTEQQAATHADLVYTIADREARAITDVMAVAVDTMASTATEGLNKVTAQADAAVAKAQTYSMGGGHQMTAAEYDAYYQTPQGIADIIRNKGKRYYEGEVLPRAGGGPVASGTPYLVGERGPELFVPDRSGTVVASGGGSSSPTVNIYITQPLGTPDAIGEAITARMKSLGMRM